MRLAESRAGLIGCGKKPAGWGTDSWNYLYARDHDHVYPNLAIAAWHQCRGLMAASGTRFSGV